MKLYTAYAQSKGGGAFHLWVRLLVAACEGGHQVIYAAPTPIAPLETLGARHVRIPAPVSWRRIGTFLGLMGLAMQVLFSWWPGRGSVAISQGSLYSFLFLPLRWKGARLLTIVHGDYVEECRANRVPGWIASLTRAAVGTGFRRSDGWMAVSTDLADRTARDFRVPRDRIRVLPAGLPKPAPSPSPGDVEAVRAAVAPHAETVLVFVGQLVAVKRVDLLLEAATRLALRRPLSVVIVGDGPLRGELERLADQRGMASKTHFAGWQNDPSPWLAAADVLVLCSLYEGTPTVLMEALSLGVVPVVSRVGGMPDVVGSDALVFAPGDPNALCDVLDRILDRSGRVRADLQAHWRSRVSAYEYVWEHRVIDLAQALWMGSDGR